MELFTTTLFSLELLKTEMPNILQVAIEVVLGKDKRKNKLKLMSVYHWEIKKNKQKATFWIPLLCWFSLDAKAPPSQSGLAHPCSDSCQTRAVGLWGGSYVIRDLKASLARSPAEFLCISVGTCGFSLFCLSPLKVKPVSVKCTRGRFSYQVSFTRADAVGCELGTVDIGLTSCCC